MPAVQAVELDEEFGFEAGGVFVAAGGLFAAAAAFAVGAEGIDFVDEDY